MGAAGFTGEVGEEAGASIIPLMVITLLGALVALLVIVTLLAIAPKREESYFTLMVLLAPGLMGAVSHCGTVQPQLPWHCEMIKG